MKKILIIGWKDLIVIFRDRGALLLMLGAPLVLTLGLGLVTGAFSGGDNSTGLADIPVAVINLDGGELSSALVDVFHSDDLADLILPVAAADEAEARRLVDDGDIAAAVIIPAGFTDSIIPQNMSTGETATAVPIEIYANPARPISGSVVQSIVQDFVNRVETGMTSIQVTMTQLVVSGAIPFNDTDQLRQIGEEIGERQISDMQAGENEVITIERDTAVAQEESEFNPLAYFAPGMAVAFLMYTVALGGRSILDERRHGTLARLLVSPSAPTQILGGKVFGIFLSGVAQVGVLVLVSGLLFGLSWGNPLSVLLLVLAVSLAATGYGLLLATVAQTPGQVNSYGSALMLIFGLIGGSFIVLPSSPFMDALSKITPNAWAIDGFVELYLGGGLSDILPQLAALLIMAVILFAVSAFLFNRRAEAIMR